MPGFGKAGISFLICIRLIVQGLAKKYRSEAKMIFQPTSPKNRLARSGQKAIFVGKK